MASPLPGTPSTPQDTQSVLTDVQRMSFAGLDLDGQVVEWTDTRGYRFASHEFLKRDGGQQEFMGRKPHRVKFNLVYVGATWRKDYNQLLGLLDKTPIGLLVHPMLGQMTVACESIDGARVSSERELDTILVPITFVESNVDQKLQYSGTESPFSHQQQFNTYSDVLNTVTTIYVTASVAISLFLTVALQFTEASIRSIASGGSPDPTLPNLFGALVINAAKARAAIRSDAKYTDDAAGYTALQAIENVVAVCHKLDDAVRSLQPQLQRYTVPAQMSLFSIAQNYYGRDALNRMDEIRNNNPGKLANPAAIPAGTVLFLAPPTVQRLKQQ